MDFVGQNAPSAAVDGRSIVATYRQEGASEIETQYGFGRKKRESKRHRFCFMCGKTLEIEERTVRAAAATHTPPVTWHSRMCAAVHLLSSGTMEWWVSSYVSIHYIRHNNPHNSVGWTGLVALQQSRGTTGWPLPMV